MPAAGSCSVTGWGIRHVCREAGAGRCLKEQGAQGAAQCFEHREMQCIDWGR